MSEESDFSYSFQINTTGPTGSRPDGASSIPALDKALIAADEFRTIGVSGGLLLVGLSTGVQMVVQPQVELALKHCNVFRTLEGHARYLVSILPQLRGDVSDVVRVLGKVRESGLFIDADSFCERINSEVTECEALDSCSAFVITCDRPADAARLLESMLQNARLAQLKRLYLIDDSRDAQNAARNREAVEHFNLMSPTAMDYVGDAEQRQIVSRLVEALPEHKDAVDFLLDRARWGNLKTHGRARTLCLLLSVGERCVIMDDDVLCEALHADPKIEGVSLSTGVCQAVCYPTVQDWRREWRPGGFDPLLGHAQCLGLSLGRALRELGASPLQPGVMGDVSAQAFRAVNADSPVLVTQSGSVGDPGMRSNAWLIFLAPGDIQQMLSQPDGLGTAWESRQFWLGFPRPTFIKQAAMSQVTGLDNRHDLPPYFPALRDEDYFFGTLTDILFPDSVALEYDWVVPHLPLEERKGNSSGDSVVPQGGLHLIAAYLSEIQPGDPAVSYATRLQLVISWLRQLAEMSTQGLEGMYHTLVARAQADVMQQLERQHTATGKLDEQWRRYLEDNARRCAAVLQKPARLADLDSASGLDNEAMAGHIRSAARGYADALAAWPAIRAAARDVLS